MYVLITGASADVHDPDDLGRLHVDPGGQPDASVQAALTAAGLGTLDGDHAWLDLAALAAACTAQPVAEDWSSRWSGLIGYATSKGWVSADGLSVRAHLQR